MTGENILVWLIVGLIAGACAGRVIQGGGYGILGDIVVGLTGAFIGGWLVNALNVSVGGGILGNIVVAFIGACILLLVARLVLRDGPSRRHRSF